MEKKYLFLGVMAVVAIILVVVFFPTEERRVKNRFHALAKWISKKPDESNVTMALKIRNIETAFAPTCALDIPARDFSGAFSAKDVAQRAAVARTEFAEIALQFYDFTVDFPAGNTAIVTTTAKLRGVSTAGDAIDETHELDCTLQKIKGKWVFSKTTVVEVLKK